MCMQIIVIVLDSEDRDYWAPHVQQTVPSPRLVCYPDLPELLTAAGADPALPTLFAISSKVYPDACPQLVGFLEQRYASSETVLLVAADAPLPQASPLVRDNIRHLVISQENDTLEGGGCRSLVSMALQKIADQADLSISEYLKPSTQVHEQSITDSEQKEPLIGKLEQSICGEGYEIDLLRQKGALLADEMLENALYGAPRRADGRARFSKGSVRLLPQEEKISFRYGFDGATLAMEVSDSWGSLSPGTVWENLSRSYEADESLEQEDGRGLFIIWRFLDHLHIHIDPGKRTVVGGQVKLVTAEELAEKKGMHLTTGRQDDKCVTEGTCARGGK
jgi:hypothetical protein